jgi:cation:H+ antiporter
MCVALAAGLPALLLRLAGAHPDEAAGAIAWNGGQLSAPLASLVFGIGVLAGAFVVSWAAELMQFDVSRNLATALVALLAVLPEYTVDIYLAWTAATVPANAPLALANMTGANRLLIGIGWPAIALAVLWTRGQKQIRIERSRWGETLFLAAATLYSFVVPFKGSLNLFDSAVFLAIFALYLRYVMRQDVHEPELEGGPVAIIGRLPVAARRLATVALFLYAGAVLFASAEPFAEGLKLTGHAWGISEFLLIQWLAPLASESPEFLIVLIFALRGQAAAGFGTLVSSKVNQWTLLVSMVPLAYAGALVYHGLPWHQLPLDPRQTGELLLTSAQSFFALAIVLNRRFAIGEALWLLVLFLAQFTASVGIENFSPVARHEHLFAIEKWFFSAIYIALGLRWFWLERSFARPLVRMVWRAESRHAR